MCRKSTSRPGTSCATSWAARCSGTSPGADIETAIVLVGGLGTRLRSVAGDLPKAMVPIAGRPFLEHLLRSLKRSGIRRAVLCVGHRAEVIQGHFGNGETVGMDVSYSVERELAGTGGAIRLGAALVDDYPVLALNGDTFAVVELSEMQRLHRERNARVTIALTRVDDAERYGTVRTDASGAIRSFGEKRATGPGLISVGWYLLERDVIDGIPGGVVSVERDVLPQWAGRGGFAFVSGGPFVDIGIPADYHRLAETPGPLLEAAGLSGANA